ATTSPGSGPTCAKRPGAACGKPKASAHVEPTMPRPDAMRLRFGPELGGLAVLVLLLAIVELLVRSALLNPFLVPQPSAVLLAFGRIVAEENVLHRFLVTGSEAGTAAVLVACIGVPLGALLHRAHLLRAAIGSWIAAVAAAPIVLAYPLFLVM